MAKMHVVTDIVIHKSIDSVFEVMNDFNHWSAWSPWLIIEKNVKVTVSDDKKFYEWEGDLVGAGNMKIAEENPNKSIHIDLTFLKPWKSKAKVTLEFQSLGEDKTELKWIMDSKLPFFMFFLKNMMSTYIRMDFERGLQLLKDYIEDDAVHSKLEFPGFSDFDGCEYIGIKSSCGIYETGEMMERDFTNLMAFFEDKPGVISGNPMTIYHVWNPVKNRVEYTCCVPVNSEIDQLPENFTKGALGKKKIHVVEHIGPYHHIGNAWSAQVSRERAKKFKKNKGAEPFEIYFNSPRNTDPNDLKTHVCFPVN